MKQAWITKGPSAPVWLTAKALAMYPTTSTVRELAEVMQEGSKQLTETSSDEGSTKPCFRLEHSKAD